MNIKIFDWTSKGGHTFRLPGRQTWAILFLLKWSSWAVGVEVLAPGLVVFIGPLAVGFGRVWP